MYRKPRSYRRLLLKTYGNKGYRPEPLIYTKWPDARNRHDVSEYCEGGPQNDQYETQLKAQPSKEDVVHQILKDPYEKGDREQENEHFSDPHRLDPPFGLF